MSVLAGSKKKMFEERVRVLEMIVDSLGVNYYGWKD